MLVWFIEYLSLLRKPLYRDFLYYRPRNSALLTALFISLGLAPKVIKRLQILKFGQEENDGPESHFKKAQST